MKSERVLTNAQKWWRFDIHSPVAWEYSKNNYKLCIAFTSRTFKIKNVEIWSLETFPWLALFSPIQPFILVLHSLLRLMPLFKRALSVGKFNAIDHASDYHVSCSYIFRLNFPISMHRLNSLSGLNGRKNSISKA